MTAVLLAATLLRPRPDGHAVHRHPQAMCGERVGMLHIYYIKTPAGQRKAADLLLRRGFAMEQVRAALGGVDFDSD